MTEQDQETAEPPALLVTEKVAARMLSISPSTLWNLAKAGKIHFVKLGEGRRFSKRYAIADLEAWVASSRTKTTTKKPRTS